MWRNSKLPLIILLSLLLNVKSQYYRYTPRWNIQAKPVDEDERELERIEKELEETVRLANTFGIETDDITADTPDHELDTEEEPLDQNALFCQSFIRNMNKHTNFFNPSPVQQRFDPGFGNQNRTFNYSPPTSSSFFSSPQSSNTSNFGFNLPSRSSSIYSNSRNSFSTQTNSPSTFSSGAGRIKCQKSYGSRLLGYGQSSEYVYFDTSTGKWKPCPEHIANQMRTPLFNF